MDTLLIYAFDEQGFHNGKKYIKNDPVSLAKAIMYYGSKAARLTITDIWDMPVCTTIGFFLDEWIGCGVSYEMSSVTKELNKLLLHSAIPDNPSEFLVQ